MQAAFPLELVAAPQASRADAGVGQPPSAPASASATPSSPRGGLQAGVAEQRDLHGRIDIDRLAQQFGDALAQRRMVGFAARPAHVAAEMLARCARRR